MKTLLIAALPLLCCADTINFGSGYQPSAQTSEFNSVTAANVVLTDPDPSRTQPLANTKWEGISQTDDGGVQIANSTTAAAILRLYDFSRPIRDRRDCRLLARTEGAHAMAILELAAEGPERNGGGR
jgi:hypothetical protein